MKEDKRITLQIKIDESVYNQIAALSVKDNRSISNISETMILNELGKLKVDFNKNISTHNDQIQAQKVYIEFLSNHLATYHSMLNTQSWFHLNEKAVKEGKELRKKIKSIESKLL